MLKKNNFDLTSFNTLRAPSIAKTFTIIEEIDELNHLIGQSFQLLGGGSNVILMPEIHTPLVQFQFSGIEIKNETPETVIVEALAGTNWQDLVVFCCENGLFGLENLALIYGTVGASPVQNIGAYGVEVGEKIEYIDVFDPTANEPFFRLKPKEALFAYRFSIFKQRPNWRVVKVGFRLNKQGQLNKNYGELKNSHATTPTDLMHEVINIRQKRLPDPKITPNAGSFFHNPIVSTDKVLELQKIYPQMPVYPQSESAFKLSAGWLIEQAGLKGYGDGAVGIYEHHALILINDGGNGEAILQFARLVQNEVQKRFQVALKIEPVIIQ